MSNILDTITEWITGFVSLVIEGVFNAIMSVFAEMYMAVASDTSSLMNLEIVQKVIKYGKGVALYLLVLKLIWDLIKTYQLYIAEDEATNPLKILRDASIAVLVITNVDWILNEIYRFGTNLMIDVVALNNLSYATLGQGIAHEMTNGVNPTSFFGVGTIVSPWGLAFVFIMMIILALMLIIICFQMAIRKAELIYYQFLAPFLSINISSPNKDLWGMLIKSVISLSVTQAIQILMIFMVFECLKTFNAITGFVYAFAFVWVALKTPQTLKQFVHGTGVGGAIGGMGRMAISAKLMRGFRK